MPERERNPRYNFIDFVEMFFVPIWEEERPREGVITISGTIEDNRTPEQRQMLNKLKEQAQDAEFEEVQN